MVVSYFLERALWRWCVGSGPSLSLYDKASRNSEIIQSDIAVYPSF